QRGHQATPAWARAGIGGTSLDRTIPPRRPPLTADQPCDIFRDSSLFYRRIILTFGKYPDTVTTSKGNTEALMPPPSQGAHANRKETPDAPPTTSHPRRSRPGFYRPRLCPGGTLARPCR